MRRIQAGQYIHDGYRIRHIDNSSFVNHGLKTVFRYWTIDDLTDGSPAEGFNTLREAKAHIDNLRRNK